MNTLLQSYQAAYDTLTEKKKAIEHELSVVAELIRKNGGEVTISDAALLTTTITHNNNKPLNIEVILSKSYKEAANWPERIVHALHLLQIPSSNMQIINKIKEIDSDSSLSVKKSVELNTSRMFRYGLIAAEGEKGNRLYYLKKEKPSI